jgi:hypothetical protein
LDPVARVLIAAGCVLLVVGIALGADQAYLRHQQAVERQQVDSYTAGVRPLAADAGRLVQQTIVPELDAYAAGRLPADKVALDATGWQLFFQRTRAGFARVAHPGRLAAVAQRFDRALAEYVAAVAELRGVAAGDAAGALAQGRAQARRADCDYANAAAALAGLRRSLDLPDVTAFPPTGCS